ncbi:MAG TPA: ATP synthase F1 subunit epsilon [Tepidisphaeraceae bacterium]|nr:ATP synthase F1 subunit epsilon [Tepidisphaeraceae bacterium]
MPFQCVIVTPEQQVLDASLKQAILPAHDGLVGILTDHAPLLIKLGTGPLQIDPAAGGASTTYFVDGGVAEMKDNRLTVLTGEATPATEISADAAKAEYAEASARQPTDQISAKDRERRMEKARVKQRVAGGRVSTKS